MDKEIITAIVENLIKNGGIWSLAVIIICIDISMLIYHHSKTNEQCHDCSGKMRTLARLNRKITRLLAIFIKTRSKDAKQEQIITKEILKRDEEGRD